MQVTLEYSSLKFFFIYGTEAAALLLIAVYAITSIRRGPWAVLGAVGGVLSGLAMLLLALGWAFLEFANSNGVFEFIAEHAAIRFVTDWMPPLGLVLIGVAFVVRGRERSAQPA